MDTGGLNEIAVVLLGAAASAVLTIALLPLITAIPRERWRLEGMRPLAMQSFSAAAIAGCVALAFRAPSVWALALTTAGGLVAIARMVGRYGTIRAVKRLTARLGDPSGRGAAIAALGPTLDRGRPPPTDGVATGAWAHATLIAAAHLVDADESAAAREVLQRLAGLRLVGISVANQSLLWAHVEIMAGHLTSARAALASVQKPIPMALLAAHAEALEMLAAACDGTGDALALAARWKHPDGWYGKIRLVARRVAHAQRGEDDQGEALEHEIERRYGARALASARELVATYVSAPSPDTDAT